MAGPIRQGRPGAAAALLEWYHASHRELPWRGTRDPYRVWVSEVMLQQTRVETVIPYYERWLRRFPNLDTLADAEPDAVLEQWEGLGYYRRARNLHKAARLVRERHAGRVPEDPATLRALPGVGEYTAGAIASIAFGARTAAIDGNARRVLARVFDLERPTTARLRKAAAAWLPVEHTGNFNQAVMELGSRVCTPSSPRCGICPIHNHCLALARGTRHLRPARAARREVPHHDIACAMIVDAENRILLVRRPENGLLGGLWEVPGTEAPTHRCTATARRLAASLLGTAPPRASSLPAVPHTFSHRRVTYRPFLYRLAGSGSGLASGSGSGGVWAAAEERERLPLPVAQRKILGLLG